MRLEPAELVVAPGTTVTATLKVERNGHDDLVTFEVENLPHGVIVDNIGLSGVLMPKGESERQIFITADAWVPETSRLCFAVENQVGNQCSPPVTVHVRKQRAAGQCRSGGEVAGPQRARLTAVTDRAAILGRVRLGNSWLRFFGTVAGVSSREGFRVSYGHHASTRPSACWRRGASGPGC